MTEDEWIGLTATARFTEAGDRKRRTLAHAPGLIIEELWYQGGTGQHGHGHDHGPGGDHAHGNGHDHAAGDAAPVAHAHDLVSGHYVLSGRFKATVGEREVELGPGDCFVAPPGVAHHLECLAAGSTLLIRTA